MGIQSTASTRLTDLDFADDLSLLAQSRATLQKMTTNLEIEAKKVGLRISAEKTKVMQIYLQGTSDRPNHCWRTEHR